MAKTAKQCYYELFREIVSCLPIYTDTIQKR